MDLLSVMMSSIFYIFFIFIYNKEIYGQKPNIIIIMADDMGMNDVSFRGSNEIFTPNIDSLAYHGVILDRFYAPALCTPSRAALLTGKHPIHTGMQHYVIPSDEPWGLPLDVKLMPEIFREAGYSTNLIGKWHLGFYKRGFTPTMRGFDYHFGYYGGYIDYYDHSLIMLDKNYSRGYDMRKNLNVNYDNYGTYATDVFNNEAVRIINEHDTSKPLLLFVNHLAPHTGNENNPMQAPQDEIEKHSHISNMTRRQYAAMITRLDNGIGDVIEALDRTQMLNNSIVIFFSDNGAPTIGMHSNGGSNYPLKGQKNSPWEGGLRTVSVIWSPLIKKTQRVFQQPMCSIDFLPTLANAAGIQLSSDLKLDGHNIWDQLANGKELGNRQILHNIDEVFGYSSYMNGQWKYVNGTTSDGIYDTWLGTNNHDFSSEMNPKIISNYTTEIFNTVVSRIFEKLKLNGSFDKLTEKRILELRKNSTINCNDSDDLEFKTNVKYNCNPLLSPCLFNIETDPCEKFNLAWKYPNIVNVLKSEVEELRKTAVPSVRRSADSNCDPALHNYTWTWWQECTTIFVPNENDSGSQLFEKVIIILLFAILLGLGFFGLLFMYRDRINIKLKLARI